MGFICGLAYTLYFFVYKKKGKIIGGVIGTDTIRFDIYGQDVAIANKMESGGSSDMVNISENTKEILER